MLDLHNAEKVDMSTLPERMRALPVERGFPVPWFVGWIDGKPEFRSMDAEKFVTAVRSKLCWVCGQRMGVNVVFVAGPMCGINRTSSEPPSHADCAVWSAINCPFLSNPRMVRREDEVSNNQKTREGSAGIAITRNPGVTMLWYTRSFEVFPDGLNKGYLCHMGEPEKVEWYANGRTATRAEVQESIDTGLPILESLAKQQSRGLDALKRYVDRFQKYLPKEPVSVEVLSEGVIDLDNFREVMLRLRARGCKDVIVDDATKTPTHWWFLKRSDGAQAAYVGTPDTFAAWANRQTGSL
jgi:hypothetical protein